jgi:hypothetical protein
MARFFQFRPFVRRFAHHERVIAQFVTLACFVGYMGLDQADFRVAPMVQDKVAAEAEQKRSASSHSANGVSPESC